MTIVFSLGGAFSQAKGAFSNWWSNFMVSPEQGQKMPETATEVQATTAETTEPLQDIPKIVNSNGIGNHETEDTCHGDKLEVLHEEICPENSHQPGEVHTV